MQENRQYTNKEINLIISRAKCHEAVKGGNVAKNDYKTGNVNLARIQGMFWAPLGLSGQLGNSGQSALKTLLPSLILMWNKGCRK